MLGAIAGDIIGSVYEFEPHKRTDFELFDPACAFTDDTVLTVALADAILSGADYADLLRRYRRAYPHRGYGGGFEAWARSPRRGPYGSLGNGSAMRTAPVGWAFDSLEEVLRQAERYAAVTHNHPEGIKGAQAVASAIFLGRKCSGKEEIKDCLAKSFGYELTRTCNQIRPTYHFDETCPGSVPEAAIAFLDSTDFESCVRLAISLGGDADTQACIAGSVAEAFYKGVPAPIRDKALAFLDDRLRDVVARFAKKYCIPWL